MTIQEAIEVIKQNKPDSDPRLCGVELKEACEVAIEALEKQMQKKTIKTDFFDSGCCPNCKRCISWIKNEYFDFDNCPYCGQALDWSNAE